VVGGHRSRKLLRQTRGHILAVLAALIAGNLLFGLTGGGRPLGTASASTVSGRSLPVAVSRMRYILEPADPALLNGVAFSVTALNGSTPSRVDVVIGDSAGARYACSPVDGGAVWTCALPGLTVAELNRIEVLAG
jgi:hypothetical protein